MKKLIILFALSFLSFINLTNAQTQLCQWAHASGGMDKDAGYSTATDANGNVFFTGTFASSTIVFGTTTLTNNSAGGGSDDIFLVKYSSSGTVLWATSAGANFSDKANGVTTDASGNVFVTGAFRGPTLVLGTTTLTNLFGSEDVFIVKYSPSGTVLWANSAGGTGINSDIGYGVSADASGNVFVVGGFASPAVAFGTTTLTNISPSGGKDDIFIVKYSPSGTLLWANSTGGSDDDDAYGVSTDSNGNVLITGSFRSPIIPFGTTNLTNAGGSGGNKDLFVAKFSPSGTVIWAQSAGGIYSEDGVSLCTDAIGNVIVAGFFNSPTLIFGATTLTNSTGSLFYTDIFIVKYSPSGTVIWANSAGGASYDQAYGLATDSNGNVFVTGGFRSPTIAFGSTILTNSNNNGWYEDIFILKYSQSGTSLWASSAGGVLYDYSYGVSTDANGDIFITGGFASPNITIGSTTLTNTDGGTLTDFFCTKVCSSIVGITENQTVESGIIIYPNPFTSQTTISFPLEQSNINIKITDVYGSELSAITHFQGQQIILEKGKMEAGIYFVQVLDQNNKRMTKKIVLQ